MARRLGPMLNALLLATLLTACAQTSGIVTTGNSKDVQKARCAGWRAITFSAKGDTEQTIKEVRTHNVVGVKKKCWK
jgi:hypothetical protein